MRNFILIYFSSGNRRNLGSNCCKWLARNTVGHQTVEPWCKMPLDLSFFQMHSGVLESKSFTVKMNVYFWCLLSPSKRNNELKAMVFRMYGVASWWGGQCCWASGTGGSLLQNWEFISLEKLCRVDIHCPCLFLLLSTCNHTGVSIIDFNSFVQSPQKS